MQVHIWWTCLNYATAPSTILKNTNPKPYLMSDERMKASGDQKLLQQFCCVTQVGLASPQTLASQDKRINFTYFKNTGHSYWNLLSVIMYNFRTHSLADSLKSFMPCLLTTGTKIFYSERSIFSSFFIIQNFAVVINWNQVEVSPYSGLTVLERGRVFGFMAKLGVTPKKNILF